jgi:hypothetical protein
MKTRKKTSKPARHTPQSFYDQEAVSLVSAWLAQTHRAMPDLKANDKFPNIDGYVEVTNEEGIHKGTLKVQIKKLSEKNALRKQYSFKDEKFLSYCRDSLDWVPILLIGVDLKKNRAFWIHIDHNFLEKNGGTKTIKFPENQQIEPGKDNFVTEWEKIIDLYAFKETEFEKYKKAFSMLSDVITPALGKTDDKFIEIHAFLDELNYYLDYQFNIIKKVYYPDTWKLGFAYSEYTKSSLTYTLYPIPLAKNDVQIKELDMITFNQIQKEGLGFVMQFTENTLASTPKEYAKEIVEGKIKKIIENKLLKHTGSPFLAKEFIFGFIDEFHLQMGLEVKDEYPLEEVEKAFYVYLPFWLQASHELLITRDRNRFKNRAQSGRIKYYDPARIFEIKKDEEIEIKTMVETFLKAGAPAPKIRMGNEEMPFGLFVEFLNYVKQAQVKIERPYRPKDFSRLKEGHSLVWSIFSKKDADKNMSLFFENLSETYKTILENNFPELRDEFSIHEKVSTILVSWNVKERYEERSSGPTYKLLYLESNRSEEKKLVVPTEEEREILNNLDFRARELTFRGVNYEIVSQERGELDFIYEKKPMLDFIYELLETRIKKYFKN